MCPQTEYHWSMYVHIFDRELEIEVKNFSCGLWNPTFRSFGIKKSYYFCFLPVIACFFLQVARLIFGTYLTLYFCDLELETEWGFKKITC